MRTERHREVRKVKEKATKDGLKLLRGYLSSMSEMSPKNNNRVFAAIESGYLKRMKDPGYSDAVAEFVGEPRDNIEIKQYFFILVRQIILQDDLRGRFCQGDKEECYGSNKT